MIEYAICIGIGMLIGWVFLPEPQLIRDFFVKIGWASPPVK